MLQGSLDNFALDEVLGLLSSTAKTGKLKLNGDRGDGLLTLHEGQLVDASASYTSNGSAPEDVVFELLRYVEGNFLFEVCEVEVGEKTRNINEVLVSAEGRLADWRTIEAVVPSLSHQVTPAMALPADEVQINRSEWATLRIIAAGCPASQVCDELGLGEVEGSRQIKGLAERGLVTVGPAASVEPPVVPPPNRGVDALTGSPARDPFARRAVLSGSIGDGPISGAAAASLDDPFGVAVDDADLESEDGFRAVPATSGDVTPLDIQPPMPVPHDSRPPMPTAPTVDDLKSLDDPGDAIPAPPPVSDDQGLAGVASGSKAGANSGNGNGNIDDHDGENKPGGLLMRYLKSDD